MRDKSEKVRESMEMSKSISMKDVERDKDKSREKGSEEVRLKPVSKEDFTRAMRLTFMRK